MTMAFGLHSAVIGEMVALALRDYKSSKVEFKVMQVSRSFFQLEGENKGTTETAGAVYLEIAGAGRKEKKCCEGTN
jgi:hypothetical protein